MIFSLFKEITVLGYHLVKNYKSVAIYDAIGKKSSNEVIAQIEKASLKTLNADLSKTSDDTSFYYPTTILEKVLRDGDEDILKVLLKKGIDVNSTPSLEHLIVRQSKEEVEKMNKFTDLMLNTNINLNWSEEVKTSEGKTFLRTYLKLIIERIGAYQAFNASSEHYQELLDKCIAKGMKNVDSIENVIVYAISKNCNESALKQILNMPHINKTTQELKKECLDLFNDPNRKFELCMENNLTNQNYVNKTLDWLQSYLEKECLLNIIPQIPDEALLQTKKVKKL